MQHTVSTTIPRPAEAIWALVGDIRSWAKWAPGMTDLEAPSGELSEGTQISYKWRGRETHSTISQYEPRRRIGISSSESSYQFTESITLHPRGEQTEVSFTMGFQPKSWWMRLASILITPFKSVVLGRSMRKEMESLRSAVETVPSGEQERA